MQLDDYLSSVLNLWPFECRLIICVTWTVNLTCRCLQRGSEHFVPLRPFRLGITTCFPFHAPHPRDSNREFVPKVFNQVLNAVGKTIKRTQCGSMALGGIFRKHLELSCSSSSIPKENRFPRDFTVVIFNLSHRSADVQKQTASHYLTNKTSCRALQ